MSRPSRYSLEVRERAVSLLGQVVREDPEEWVGQAARSLLDRRW